MEPGKAVGSQSLLAEIYCSIGPHVLGNKFENKVQAGSDSKRLHCFDSNR